MHKGAIVYMMILSALLLAMVVAFVVYIYRLPKPDAAGKTSTPDSSEIGFDPNSPGEIYNGLNNGDFTEVEDEITLVEDKGETQNREDDKEESKGSPDENAKSISLEKKPTDKEKDSNYTVQSAYDSVCDSVVTVVCYKEKITDSSSDIVSQGTGTVISSDGYIVTNAHVIGNSKAYVVNIVFNSGKKYQAKIIGYDTWSDLAVLKIDAKDLKAVKFGDSELIDIGEDVITVGSPGGEKFKNSLTKGVVSAVNRELSVNKYVRYIPPATPAALCATSTVRSSASPPPRRPRPTMRT